MIDDGPGGVGGALSFDALMAILAPFMVIIAIWGLIGIGFFIWYLAAMARLFPRIGLPAGQGWIPLWNEWRLIGRAGLPGWVVILYLVPVANIVPVIFRTIAQHRIGREAGVGGGYTVLGLLIPPLWATLLGSVIGPQGLHAQPASFGRVGSAPQAPPAYGAPVPPAPGSMPSPAGPDPWASPAQARAFAPPADPPAPVPDVQPRQEAPRLPAGPLGGETEAEYARLAAEPFQAPPATPLGEPLAPEPFSWTAASRSADPEPDAAPAPPPPVHPVAAVPVMAPPLSAPSPAVQSPPLPEPRPAADPAATPRSAVRKPTGITASYDLPLVQEEDLDRTVVVPRALRAGWVIELPDGGTLPLEPDTVLGRRPEGRDGAHSLEIPDPTRTLSKTHARLRWDGERWIVEDLGSTNGVVLLRDDGREEELAANRPTPAGSRLLLGRLEIRIRRDDETA